MYSKVLFSGKSRDLRSTLELKGEFNVDSISLYLDLKSSSLCPET